MSYGFDTQNRARAVISHGSRILVARPNGLNQEFDSNMLFLPGGHIKRGETARSAIIRELTEELGSRWERVSPVLLGVGDTHWLDANGYLQDEINIIFWITLPEDMEPHDACSKVEYLDYLWMDMDEAAQALYPRSIARCLPAWIEHMHGEQCFVEEIPSAK